MPGSPSPALALVVAGSDASGHAGIQTDNRAMLAAGVFPLNVITALTLQTGKGVESIEVTSSELVRMHLIALLNAYPVKVLKAGMLGSVGNVSVLIEVLEQYPDIHLVLDPVLSASSGRPLLEKEGVEKLRQGLLKHCYLLTPNLPELAQLSGMPEVSSDEEEKYAVEELLSAGCKAILVKGGHRQGDQALDRLYQKGVVAELAAKSVTTFNDRGTGCALASLIAAGLVQGFDLESACRKAKTMLSRSLENQAVVDWPGAGPSFL